MGHVDNAGTVTNANTTTRTTKAVKSLPMPKVWAFAVGQFGWALLSGIISNWLVYFYQPDNETISQGQTVFVPQGLAVLGIVTVVGGITAFARFFDAFVDPAVASLSDRCTSKPVVACRSSNLRPFRSPSSPCWCFGVQSTIRAGSTARSCSSR